MNLRSNFLYFALFSLAQKFKTYQKFTTAKSAELSNLNKKFCCITYGSSEVLCDIFLDLFAMETCCRIFYDWQTLIKQNEIFAEITSTAFASNFIVHLLGIHPFPLLRRFAFHSQS